jgi:pilus assembly protein Flp/PilA
MQAIATAVKAFAHDEDGITAIEYGLLAAVIAGVLAVSFKALGTQIDTAFDRIATAINTALPA